MNDQEAGGRIMAQAFHDELQIIAQEKGMEKDAFVKGLYQAAKAGMKGIGAAAKGGMASAKKSMVSMKSGKRGTISRYAKATGTGAKSFAKKLTKGQAAGLAAGAGAGGAYAAS